jgi:O-antigen/teichoic acid export membrane protein
MNAGAIANRPWLRSVASKIAGVTLANAAITALGIVAGVAVARGFSIAEYGELSYFVNIFGTLRLLGSIGLTSQISYELAQARGRGEPAWPVLARLLALRLVTLVALALAIVAAGALRADRLLMLAGCAAALALLCDFGVGALQGLGRVRQVIAALTIQPVVYALGLIPALWLRWPVAAVYLIYAGSFLPAAALVARSLRQAVPRVAGGRPAVSLAAALRFAGGMYGLAICGTVITSYATLYLGGGGRFADAALITIPLNLVFMPGLLVNMAISTVYFPRMSHAQAQGNAAEQQALFHTFAAVVSGAGLLIAASLLLYPSALLYLLYGTRYLASAPLLRLLALVAYIYPLQTVLTVTLAAQRRMRAALCQLGVATLLLVALITLAAQGGFDLRLVALAHLAALLPVLLWQLRTASYSLRPLVRPTAAQLALLLAAGAAARALVPDAPASLPGALLALGAITLAYAGWAWKTAYKVSQ